MNLTRVLLIAALVVAVAACAPEDSVKTSPSPTAAPGAAPTDLPQPTSRSGTIRIEYPVDPDVHDIPWLIACESLQQIGYTLERTDMDDPLSFVAALDEGNLDLSWMSTQIAYSAVARKVDIIAILDRSYNANLLATGTAIQKCADLDGKSIAVPGVTSPSTVIVDTYVNKTCSGTTIQKLVITGHSNRAAALLSGAVDGAVQDIDGLLRLNRERPGEFHALIPFSQVASEVLINTCVVRRAFAQEHPQVIEDIIQTVMLARRSLKDPADLARAIEQYLEYSPEQAKESAEAYASLGAWDLEGTYDLTKVQATLDFLQQSDAVPSGLRPEDVADLSYYESALAELDGR